MSQQRTPSFGTVDPNHRNTAPIASCQAGDTGVTTADLYCAAWASSLGSALEYHDFALYNLASALIFAPLFFPSQTPGSRHDA